MSRVSRALAVVLPVAVISVAVVVTRSPSPEPSGSRWPAAARDDASPLLDLLPTFVENRGQTDPRASYYLEGSGRAVFFTSRGLRLALGDPVRPWNVALDLMGARGEPVGVARRPGVVSYFHGKPADWVTGVPTYRALIHRDAWPGIDLGYSASAHGLKYELRVDPGVDPSMIQLAWRGGDVRPGANGNLELVTPAGTILDRAPVAWQRVQGGRVPVEISFEFHGNGYGFEIGTYDPARPLVIDPALVYSGFIGGDQNDAGTGVAVDAAGNAYLVGRTSSPAASFPETVGPDLAENGNQDAFIAKIDPAGTALLYAGFIGGSADDVAEAVAVDGSGAAYVTGSAEFTATFPVVGPLDPSHNGNSDAFVAKVNPGGTALVYSGFIGGDQADYGHDVAIDAAGAAYVAGDAASDENTFPEAVGPDPSHNGGLRDGFVAKVTPGGTALVYAGYIGGDQADFANGIAVDAAGNAYLVGDADSDETTFPDGNGGPTGPDTSHNGGTDAFVAKVNPAGNALVYSGYIGGTSFDFGKGAAVTSDGRLSVAGFTASDEASFPVAVGPDLTQNLGDDAYVARVNPAGSGLEYAGFIGGDGADFANDVTLDSTGAAYVAGYTNSTQATFPVAVGPDLTHGGGNDAFIVKVAAAGSPLVYAGYVGGSGDELGDAVAVDVGGNAYITGDTNSTEATFPAVVGPDPTANGAADAFVAKVETTATCQGRLVTHLGSDGNDLISGTGGTDVVLALGGNDRVNVKGGKDRVCAGPNNDRVRGGGGNDRLLGEQGRDALNGGAGKRDVCKGGPGKDKGGKGCEKGRL